MDIFQSHAYYKVLLPAPGLLHSNFPPLCFSDIFLKQKANLDFLLKVWLLPIIYSVKSTLHIILNIIYNYLLPTESFGLISTIFILLTKDSEYGISKGQDIFPDDPFHLDFSLPPLVISIHLLRLSLISSVVKLVFIIPCQPVTPLALSMDLYYGTVTSADLSLSPRILCGI